MRGLAAAVMVVVAACGADGTLTVYVDINGATADFRNGGCDCENDRHPLAIGECQITSDIGCSCAPACEDMATILDKYRRSVRVFGCGMTVDLALPGGFPAAPRVTASAELEVTHVFWETDPGLAVIELDATNGFKGVSCRIAARNGGHDLSIGHADIYEVSARSEEPTIETSSPFGDTTIIVQSAVTTVQL